MVRFGTSAPPRAARPSEISQSHDFSYIFTDFTNAATQSFTPIPAAGFVGTFNPFDASLGTLISPTVSWSITSAFTGIAGSTSSSHGASIDGDYYINTAIYSGNGGGGSTGSSIPGNTMNSSFTVPGSNTFLPANAGVSYDPAIGAALTGTSPFTATWNTGTSTNAYTATYVSSGTVSVTGSASVTYDYQPIPEPASPLILLPALGLLAAVTRRRPA